MQMAKSRHAPAHHHLCEMTGLEDPLWTYYMACGWHRRPQPFEVFMEDGQFILSHRGFVEGFTEYETLFERPATGRSPADMELPLLP